MNVVYLQSNPVFKIHADARKWHAKGHMRIRRQVTRALHEQQGHHSGRNWDL